MIFTGVESAAANADGPRSSPRRRIPSRQLAWLRRAGNQIGCVAGEMAVGRPSHDGPDPVDVEVDLGDRTVGLIPKQESTPDPPTGTRLGAVQVRIPPWVTTITVSSRRPVRASRSPSPIRSHSSRRSSPPGNRACALPPRQASRTVSNSSHRSAVGVRPSRSPTSSSRNSSTTCTGNPCTAATTSAVSTARRSGEQKTAVTGSAASARAVCRACRTPLPVSG